MTDAAPPLLFAPETSAPLGRRIVAALGTELAPLEERAFEAGEHKARPLVSVRGRDVYLIQSLHGSAEASANDRLVRLLLLIGAMATNGAGRITAVVPYLCYARKDRRTQPRDPVNTRTLAQLFEAAGAERVLALDVHNAAAFENAFRKPVEQLTALPLILEWSAPRLAGRDVVVLSPDAGAMKRAEQVRQALERWLDRPVAAAIMEKYRSAGAVRGTLLAGELAGRSVLVVDDMTETGGTLLRAAEAARAAGALEVFGAVTHAPELPSDSPLLAGDPLDTLAVTDSVHPLRPDSERLHVLETAPLFAEAINALARGGSLTELAEARLRPTR